MHLTAEINAPLAHHLSGSRLKRKTRGNRQAPIILINCSRADREYRRTESVVVAAGTSLRVARIAARVSKAFAADGPAFEEIGGQYFLGI